MNRLLLLLLLSLCITSNAQSLSGFTFPDEFKILHRYDYRKKIDNRYIGHTYREVRGLLHHQGLGEYKGYYFKLEETKRDAQLTSRGIDQRVEVSLNIDEKGQWNTASRQPYPLFLQFPQAPPEELQAGGMWFGAGFRMLDPLNTGTVTKVPILSEFEFHGETDYAGQRVLLITGQYALRYKQGEDPQGDWSLKRVEGRHKIAFYLTLGGQPIFLRDQFTDQYVYSNGSVEEQTGFHLIWYKDVVPLDRGELQQRLARILEDPSASGDRGLDGDDGEVTGDTTSSETGGKDLYDVGDVIQPVATEDFTIEQKEEGLSLSLHSLQFQPDEAVLLPGEEEKLKGIVRVLNGLPERTIMVVGHTADVGSFESQKVLSLKRAQTIVETLQKLGISPGRLLYDGRAGLEPMASNNTEEGRKRNRRVEFLILED